MPQMKEENNHNERKFQSLGNFDQNSPIKSENRYKYEKSMEREQHIQNIRNRTPLNHIKEEGVSMSENSDNSVKEEASADDHQQNDINANDNEQMNLNLSYEQLLTLCLQQQYQIQQQNCQIEHQQSGHHN